MKLKRRVNNPKGMHAKTGGLLNFSDYKKKRHIFGHWTMVIVLLLFTFIAVFPVFWLVVSSFKTTAEINSVNYHLFPNSWSFDQFVDLWQRLGLGQIFVNTILVVIGAVIFAVIFNSIIAYVVAVIKPVGYKALNVMILLAYMIPSALGILPLIMAIQKFGMLGSYWPLMLVFGANAYYYLLFKNYFEKLPSSLIEASRMDGLGSLKIFFKVVLPLARPIIGVVAIFAMTAAYSDYLLPYLVLGQSSDSSSWTLMVAIYNFSSDTEVKANQLLQLLVLSIIPQILIFMIFQKQIMNQGVNTGNKE